MRSLIAAASPLVQYFPLSKSFLEYEVGVFGGRGEARHMVLILWMVLWVVLYMVLVPSVVPRWSGSLGGSLHGLVLSEVLSVVLRLVLRCDDGKCPQTTSPRELPAAQAQVLSVKLS